jgi:hypothetical protein
MDLNQAYWMLCLAMANYIQSLEAYNLPADECTKEGDFNEQYVKDRFADDLGEQFFKDTTALLNGKQL